MRVWGFRLDNLVHASRAPAAFAAVALVAMAIYGGLQGTLTWRPAMAVLLLLYPSWGLIQQFLLQAMFARNLHREVAWLRSPWRLAPLNALLFGLVHAPDLALMGATFLMGLAFTPMYLRDRNLWPLGVFHGWARCVRLLLGAGTGSLGGAPGGMSCPLPHAMGTMGRAQSRSMGRAWSRPLGRASSRPPGRAQSRSMGRAWSRPPRRDERPEFEAAGWPGPGHAL